MSTEPVSTAKVWDDFFRDVNRRTPLAFTYWSAMLIYGSVLMFLWSRGKAGHPMYGLLVTAWTWILGPGLAIPVMLHVPARWFCVPSGERRIHRALGVRLFARLLHSTGYNRRAVHPMWGFSINRAGLPLRAQAARGGASAHGASFVIHLVLATGALVAGYSRGALYILLPGVLLHLYPVLLQRAILLQLQPLLNKSDKARAFAR